LEYICANECNDVPLYLETQIYSKNNLNDFYSLWNSNVYWTMSFHINESCLDTMWLIWKFSSQKMSFSAKMQQMCGKLKFWQEITSIDDKHI